MLLSATSWLDDLVVTATQYLIKKQYPHMGGLQAPSLTQGLAITPPDKEFVQIVNIKDNHWIAISTVGCHEAATVRVFDSFDLRLSKPSLRLLSHLMSTQTD